MATGELTCHELVQLVTDYLEGAMSQPDRDRLEMHLAGCRPCRHYLDQMQRTIKSVGALREDEVSQDAQTELLSVFRAWKQG